MVLLVSCSYCKPTLFYLRTVSFKYLGDSSCNYNWKNCAASPRFWPQDRDKLCKNQVSRNNDIKKKRKETRWSHILLTPFGAQLIETTSHAFIICVSHLPEWKPQGAATSPVSYSPRLEPHWGLSGYNIAEWENERKKWTLTHYNFTYWLTAISWQGTRMKDTNSKLKRSFLFSSHLKDAKPKLVTFSSPHGSTKIIPTSCKSFARFVAFGTH